MDINYDPIPYKIVFFSSAPIGIPFLQELNKDNRFEVVGVVTQCDKPAGRGMEICENIIKTEGKKIFQKNIKIVDYSPQHQKAVGKIYDQCFNLPKFGVRYNFDYFNKNIVSRSKAKSYIGKTLLKENNVIGYYQAFSIQDMKDYLGEIFEDKWQKSFQKDNIDSNKVYVLDDIFIEETNRKKGYFDLLLNDLYSEVVYKEYSHIAIYTIKELVTIYEKRGFKTIDQIYNKKDQVEYYIMVKEISGSNIAQYSNFIQTPTKINPDKSEEGKKFYQWLKNKEVDFLVVIAYGKIIPQSILDSCNIAPINVHGSLLPKYRGASPIQSVFLNNESETGITMMKMDSQMDTGNMIDMLKFKIDFSRTSQNIISEIMNKGPKFLNDTLWKFGKKELVDIPQNHDKATYCKKIEKENGLINPQKDSIQDIYNKYRAFFLWPKIFFMHNNKRIIIEELELDQKLFDNHKYNTLLDEKRLLNPCIKNIKLKPEGKKSMNRESFTAGYIK